jgi:hypothetical protein
MKAWRLFLSPEIMELRLTNQNSNPFSHALRGNVETLFALNERQCIRITPKTSQSHWMGEKMDDQLAVEGLLFRE